MTLNILFLSFGSGSVHDNDILICINCSINRDFSTAAANYSVIWKLWDMAFTLTSFESESTFVERDESKRRGEDLAGPQDGLHVPEQVLELTWLYIPSTAESIGHSKTAKKPQLKSPKFYTIFLNDQFLFSHNVTPMGSYLVCLSVCVLILSVTHVTNTWH